MLNSVKVYKVCKVYKVHKVCKVYKVIDGFIKFRTTNLYGF